MSTVAPGRYRHPKGDLVVVEEVTATEVRGYTEGPWRISGDGPFTVLRSVFLGWSCVLEQAAETAQCDLFGGRR